MLLKFLISFLYLTPVQSGIETINHSYYAYQQQRIEKQIWGIMIQKESQGRHFDKYGKPLKSHKGAIGIAQVMPSTAKLMAKKLNIKFDYNLYRKDVDYNQMLGLEYFKHNIEIFNDPLLGAVAYNAGTRRVQLWIKEFGDPSQDNDLTYRDFISSIPYKETREYGMKILEELNL